MNQQQRLQNLLEWLDKQIEETPEITNGVYSKYRENVLEELEKLSTR